MWDLPAAHYRREIGPATLLVLDMLPAGPDESPMVPAETLAWLEGALATVGERVAIIAEHCPLAATVGDRDPVQVLDFSTSNPRQPAFRLGNSAQVRAVLARHPGPRLFLAGHTHSGWAAPDLVKTEWLGGAPVTFVNLMSLFFTGQGAGANQPEVVMLWQIDLAAAETTLTAHDLLGGRIARSWPIPLR
jgi:hypothetical protein